MSALTRSLLELLGLALARRDAPTFLESASAGWRGRGLRRAALSAARALRAGEPLSDALEGRLPEHGLAALRAGELRGDPAGGLAHAARSAKRGALVGHLILAPAAYPLAVVAVSGLAAALLAGVAAPPLQALRVELAGLAGRPEPGGLLALAAGHPSAAVAVGLALGLLPLLLPLLVMAAARTRTGSRGLLRLPFFGPIARWRATADLADTLADQLAAGVEHGRAWAASASAVGPIALRERLRAASCRAEAGDPLHELLAAAGLPAAALHALSPELLAEDGGVSALHRLAERAEEAHRRLVDRSGRALSLGAGLAGTLLAAALLATVLLPLLAAGGA